MEELVDDRRSKPFLYVKLLNCSEKGSLKEEEKNGFIYEEIIHFQRMKRCKGVYSLGKILR